ncbi:kinetochore component CENP-S-domain-containing protein [Phakopsora pachyrhizi]|uniref:Kinetochore component CENP-S-domain-containing protein n=1 Tax=Phakopsora pachyrhizi TaxID=170000 RepID=A0AAV0BEG5_PHAPC|nr:kinetochore component CENP-S-domain-containing protein [Phakopsora pachyrhizi]CAH7684801.1 kinetochore component CENP-S-domain-containing protein [Phakopsora pachyrhizi]
MVKDDSIDQGDIGSSSESLETFEINKQSLKAAIWYTVAQIVQEEEVDLQISSTEPFVASVTELVYAQIETLALDLKSFATHAGRSTIRADDVKLMARKNSALLDLIEEELRRLTRNESDPMGSDLKSIRPKPRSKPKRVGNAQKPKT